MKKYIRFFIALILCNVSLAAISQVRTSPFTINAACQDFKNQAISIEWSLGDVLITNEIVVNESADPRTGYIKVFPTAAKDYIRVLYKKGQKGNVNIAVIDILGRPLMKNSFQINENTITSIIPLSGLSKGSYFLHIELSNPNEPAHQSIFKFIKL